MSVRSIAIGPRNTSFDSAPLRVAEAVPSGDEGLGMTKPLAVNSSSPYAHVGRELAGTAFGTIDYSVETGSTNTDATEHLADERFAGRTFVAEHQTRGSGRKGRSWSSRPGSSLLCTTILPRTVPTRDLWIVPFWAGLAVRKALQSCGVGALLHWPNDLLLEERKVAGVLCASRIVGETAWVACGVGINVCRFPEADAEIEPPPGFCDDVARVDRAELLRAILLDYEATLDALANPQRLARLWEAQAGLPGRRYLLLKDQQATPFEGIALALATGGGLVVSHKDGSCETISLADARALR